MSEMSINEAYSSVFTCSWNFHSFSPPSMTLFSVIKSNLIICWLRSAAPSGWAPVPVARCWQ